MALRCGGDGELCEAITERMGPFSIVSHLAMNIESPEDRDEKWGKHIWHLGVPECKLDLSGG